MTMRLDLAKRYDLMPGHSRTILRVDCFGCGDCGRWFQFARELVAHICQERISDDAS